CAFARQSLQRGATALDGFPGLKQVAWEPPQRAALPLREIKNHLCKRSSVAVRVAFRRKVQNLKSKIMPILKKNAIDIYSQTFVLSGFLNFEF
nr:hypothetical protein [Nostoc sp. SerVER01]